MKTIEITGYIYFQQYDWDKKGNFVISQYPKDVAEDQGRKFIKEQIFVVEVPENVDMRQTKVEALEKQRKKIQSEFTVRVNEINRKINELLAIENE